MKIKSKKLVDTNNQSQKCVIIASISNVVIDNDFNSLSIHYIVKNTSNSTIISDTFKLFGEELDKIWTETKNLIEKNYHTWDYRIKLQLEYFGIFMNLISKKFNINIDDLEVIETENFIF